MIPGPCGIQNRNSPCINENKNNCTKNFPEKFMDNTDFNNDVGFPLYRRRDDKRIIRFGNEKNERIADNGFVVPYNPYLLLRLQSHINVEVCCTIKCIK